VFPGLEYLVSATLLLLSYFQFKRLKGIQTQLEESVTFPTLGSINEDTEISPPTPSILMTKWTNGQSLLDNR
jgi:hypothetical protein